MMLVDEAVQPVGNIIDNLGNLIEGVQRLEDI